MGIFKRKNAAKPVYDPARQQPAVRKSICTGEMTLGFADRDSGKFHEYMLAHTPAELEKFCRDTDINPEDIREIY